MTVLANAFSWSHSRHAVFQTCLKRYFFAYYAAWGGWASAAPAPAREAYRLKRLATRQQWAGHHAHGAIEYLLKNARRDPALAAGAETRQIELMRQEFRDSRAGAYRGDPARIPGLFEHEYQLEVPPAEWKATVDRVVAAVRNFLESDLWRDLQTQPDEAFLATERRASFLLDGLKVLAVPDLVVRRNGRVQLYDWKTGTADPEEHRTQLGVYALLALDRWTAAPEEIEAVVFNPVRGQRTEFSFAGGELETIREFIRDSADEMLFPLAHPETNDPGDGREFECTAVEASCKTCPFLRICPRWTT